MRNLVILSVLFFVAAASALPSRRWELTHGFEGKMHLVDLKPFEEVAEPFFDVNADTHFNLFTPQNPTVSQRIVIGDLASLQNSNFNPANPTRFTVHGWGGSSTDGFNRNTASAYLGRGAYNMIAVDWSVGAGSNNYITSRNRVGVTGERVAQMVDFLHQHGYIQFSTTHFIGFSLGGHLVGHIGKAVTRGRAHVIYALDPAGPLFTMGNPDGRVDIGDAVYVETMITNGGTLGFMGALGHVNFFPNFGRSQPGCGTDTGGSCAHSRAVQFFVEAIERSVFTGRECSSFAEISNGNCSPTGRTTTMGGLTPNIGMTGNYIFTTNANAPFSQG